MADDALKQIKQTLPDNGQREMNSELSSARNVIILAKICFFFLGLLNNCGSTIVLSGAYELSRRFGQGHLMSLFSGCLNIFSIAVAIINAKYLLRVPHQKRVGAATILFIAGLCCILTSLVIESFGIALFGSTLIGIGCACGTASIQGFMKEFPPEVFGGFASGTGFAGLFGSVYCLTLKISSIDPGRIFLILFPLYACYFLIFVLAVRLRTKYQAACSIPVSVFLLHSPSQNSTLAYSQPTTPSKLFSVVISLDPF